MATASIPSGLPESGSADKRHIGFRTDLLSDIEKITVKAGKHWNFSAPHPLKAVERK